MRVSLLSLTVIASSLLIVCAAIVLGVWLRRRQRDVRLREHGKPMLVMPQAPSDVMPRASFVHDAPVVRRSPITALAVAERVTPEELVIEPQFVREGELVTVTTTDAPSDGELVHGHALRYHRPVDRTLQFLPGYLQVVEGIDAGQEIHFVRTAGPDGTSVTFGRSEGQAYRHVQLLEPTVSRVHARLSLDPDGWFLTNLSKTNPVLVNGRAVAGTTASALRDGDSIEMGALVFRFHAR
jgi:FHA domain